VLQLTCRISTLGKWIALQPLAYTQLDGDIQVERGADGVEAEPCGLVEPSVVQILIGVAIRLHAVH